MEPGEHIKGPTASALPIFRVFLASPGEVALERKLLREAITHIGNEWRFRERINIELIACDQPGTAVPMEAGLTPQQAIAQRLTKPAECGLAVILFWSRIGTPLPADFKVREDGTPYRSGTEWEYHNALQAYQRNHKPTVWVYRHKGAPQFSVDDPELLDKHEVLRGGSWGLDPRSVRSANRDRGTPDDRFSDIGFRLARML